MDDIRYRIGELAEKAGVTKRTIHYYTGRGLIPPPDGTGLGTTYSQEHLYRVMLIKKLQDDFLPLEEIKKRMAGMRPEDVKLCLEEDEDGFGGKTNSLGKGKGGTKGRTTDRNMPVSAFGEQHAGIPEVRGDPYERIEVGFGLELHYPAGSRKARELAEVLYEQARKWMREG